MSEPDYLVTEEAPGMWLVWQIRDDDHRLLGEFATESRAHAWIRRLRLLQHDLHRRFPRR